MAAMELVQALGDFSRENLDSRILRLRDGVDRLLLENTVIQLCRGESRIGARWPTDEFEIANGLGLFTSTSTLEERLGIPYPVHLPSCNQCTSRFHPLYPWPTETKPSQFETALSLAPLFFHFRSLSQNEKCSNWGLGIVSCRNGAKYGTGVALHGGSWTVPPSSIRFAGGRGAKMSVPLERLRLPLDMGIQSSIYQSLVASDENPRCVLALETARELSFFVLTV